MSGAPLTGRVRRRISLRKIGGAVGAGASWDMAMASTTLTFALTLALVSAAASPTLAQGPRPSPTTAGPGALATPQAQTSYAIGLNIGSGLRADGVAIDPDAFLKGVKDALADAKPALSNEQMNAILGQLQQSINQHRTEKAAAAAAVNKAQGDAFLKANGAKPGVRTLPSGLQYQILTPGTGVTPKPSDTVICNYTGTLIDGTEFDSSAKHGGPANLSVDGVIPGWSEALQLMPVGSKWRLFVPSDLAYGAQGAGEDIGPNAVLIFDIELLSIETE
ncbi:MAG TPA: FKBP-type peptidyl-prolyl cis-trans isomerase [Caulobacteraceae bacterium]|nr:FKBP-type peptidyl-prolyl cis-trans isomerase [Caulobacteraceae bacterium]